MNRSKLALRVALLALAAQTASVLRELCSLALQHRHTRRSRQANNARAQAALDNLRERIHRIRTDMSDRQSLLNQSGAPVAARCVVSTVSDRARDVEERHAALVIERLERLRGTYQANAALDYCGSQVADDLDDLLDWIAGPAWEEAREEVEAQP